MDANLKNKRMKKFGLWLCILIVLISCVSQEADLTPTSLPHTAIEAQEVLIRFFDLLNSKQYTEANILYGGSYQGLQEWNPDIDPLNHVMLLTRACEQNGLQCLKTRTTKFKKLQGNSYIFQVEFTNPDGSLFVRGPCCGANDTDMPPESQFEYEVAITSEGKFLVMDLPPYVP